MMLYFTFKFGNKGVKRKQEQEVALKLGLNNVVIYTSFVDSGYPNKIMLMKKKLTC